MSENERPETGTPLTRRELRELEQRRALAASAALAELATTDVTSPAEPAGSTVREAWQPPPAPASTGPALTRRELRQRNVEVEPVRLSVPSQSPAPALEAGATPAPPEVAPIEVAAVRDHAEDPGHLPVSRLAAAVQGRRDGMRDAVSAGPQPHSAQAVSPGGVAVEARPSLRLEAGAESGALLAGAPDGTVEPAVVTDGFGMPAVLMDAPVLPALRPIEELEAEVARRALGGVDPGDGPAAPEPTDPPEPAEPVAPGGPAESTGQAEPAAGSESARVWDLDSWEPGGWEPAAGPEPVGSDDPASEDPADAEPPSLAPFDDAPFADVPFDGAAFDDVPFAAALADAAPDDADPVGALPATSFEPALGAAVPSPRTVTSQRLGLEHAAAMAAPAASTRRRAPAPRPQPASSDVLKVPVGRWQAVYGAWIGAVAIVVWALGPIALVLGIWSLVQARAEGYGRGRPYTAIVCGAVGTILGVLFLVFSPT